MSHRESEYNDMKKQYGDEQIESLEHQQTSTSEQLTDLSAIEATAASKAAWLIASTVSIGGFLFGKAKIIIRR